MDAGHGAAFAEKHSAWMPSRETLCIPAMVIANPFAKAVADIRAELAISAGNH